jgi:hypothetical protein
MRRSECVRACARAAAPFGAATAAAGLYRRDGAAEEGCAQLSIARAPRAHHRTFIFGCGVPSLTG